MEQQQEQSQPPKERSLQNEDNSASKATMSLESVRETMYEEQGYDAPFATITWGHWMDLQTRTMQSFSRFVRAVEERRPDHAIMIGLEMQEIATSMLLEAYAQCTSISLEALPADRLKYVKV